MKKAMLLLLTISSLLSLLSGCAGKESEVSAPAAVDSSKPAVMENSPNADAQGEDAEVDVDLTLLSSMMVYGEVYQMMIAPESYVGKTIKMRGLYYASYYDVTDQYFHFVVIEDAAACCSQGLEFIWLGEHTYPDDYPQDETVIEVTGVFELYHEDGYDFSRIVASSMNVL